MDGPERCTVILGPAEDAHSILKQKKARREQQHQHSVKVWTVTQISYTRVVIDLSIQAQPLFFCFL